MADQFALIARQLTDLLGSPNVTPGKEQIVARPSSSSEIAGIFNLAARAALTARADGYTVGPATAAAGRKDILISLERMNQIKIDRDRLTIIAQPAAEMHKLVNAARETGYIFPGGNCRHKQATVGENVAACFNEGAPDFKCANACLCGLELVLADGRVITVGERSIKDLDNYQLTYILGGYKEKKAVLSGIHLKLLPEAQERYWLITACKDMATLPKILSSLIQKYRPNLAAFAGVQPAVHPDLPSMLRQWSPDFNVADHPAAACLLVSINCSPGELEPVLELLSGELNDNGPADISIAGDTYQKLVISTFHSTLPAGLKANPQLSPVIIPEQDCTEQIKTSRLAAVYWLKEENKVYLFYLPQ